MPNTPSSDTIAAIATPTGRGGVGIVRVSGSLAAHIAEQMIGHCPRPRYAEYVPFMDGSSQIIDQGIALYFPAPHSFTGEDVLELQGHGGPVVMDMLLRSAVQFGARQARSGEFSERAFLNDKLDLAQAEAIADLIDASSEQAARQALRSLQGAFSEAVYALVEALTQLRIYVEAAMDFPEEEIDFISEGQVQQKIQQRIDELEVLLQQARQGSVMREGIQLVLIGRPNAGKSSLMNALARRDAAIVTEIPGTTRDVLREVVILDGLPVHIMDTAGLRDSQDPVEQEGMRRTWSAIEQADVVILLVDDVAGFSQIEKQILQQSQQKTGQRVPFVVLYNKCDLSDRPPGLVSEEAVPAAEVCLSISARQQLGMTELINQIKRLSGIQASGEGVFTARRRHLSALQQALEHLQTAEQQAAHKEGELIAEELRQAQERLGDITGRLSSDDLLGRIFGEFCIGK